MSSKSRYRAAAFLGYCTGLLALFLLVNLNKVPLTRSLDSSMIAVNTFAFSHSLQFGRDLIFPYGPLGHLVHPIYTKTLWLPQLGTDLLIKALYLICVAVIALRLSWPRRIAFCLFAFGSAFYSFQAMYLFLLTAMAWLIFVHLPLPYLYLFSCLTFMATAALVKVTFLLVDFFFLSVGLAYHCYLRQWKRGLVPIFLFGLAFLGLWTICGQRLSSVSSYFFSALHVVSGYSEAVSLVPSLPVLTLGILAFLAASLQIALYLVRRRWDGRAWLMSLFLFAALCQVWKLSYSRADAHTIEVFLYGAVATLAMPAFYAEKVKRAWDRMVDYLAVAILAAGCAYIFPSQTSFTPAIVSRQVWGVARDHLAFICHPMRYREAWARSLQHDMEGLSLPLSRALVNRSTVDVFGNEQSAALANDFNYVPRPVFQSYMTFTPWLAKMNGDFYRSEQAPAYVLFDLATIDSRIPSLDDAETLLLLISRYHPILKERNFTLLQQRRSSPLSFQPLRSGVISIGEEISVPRGVVWSRLALKPSWLGRLVGLIYQPPEIWIDFTTSSGRPLRYHLIRRLAANGFLINPLLRVSGDFTNLISGLPPRDEIARLKVEPSPGMRWLMRPKIEFSFGRVNGISMAN